MTDAVTPRLKLLWMVAGCLLIALASAWGMATRYRVEEANHAVGLVAELDVIRDLSASEGRPLAETLERLKSKGLNVVAVSERSVRDYVIEGRLFLRSSGGDSTWVEGEPALRQQLQNILFPRGPANGVRENATQIPMPIGTVLSRPMGVDPLDVAAVRAAGMELLVRHGNPAGLTRDQMMATLQSSANAGARYFLPAGEQVIGFDALLPELPDTLRLLNMHYAAPEFAKIFGDAQMVGKDPENVVRLHAAQAAEMPRLRQAGAVERYAKAYRERNIRLLLLRPATLSSDSPLTSFADYIGAVRQGVEREGGAIKSPRPFGALEPVKIGPIPVVAAAVAVGVALLVFSLPYVWSGLAAGAVGFGLLGLAATGRAELITLAAAVLTPVVAYLWLIDHPGRALPLQYVGVSLISLVGGLAVAGTLTSTGYLVQADQFSGIKVAVFLPIVVVAALFTLTVQDWRTLAATPTTWGTLIGGAVLAFALAFMLSRTGNDGPAGVSGSELAFRDLLERLLYVRPRTKEFLIGHPALAVGLMLWAQARGSRPGLMPAALLLLSISVVGQTSVVNTLCHLHSPLDLHFSRILTGHIVGLLIGLPVAVVVHLWLQRNPAIGAPKG